MGGAARMASLVVLIVAYVAVSLPNLTGAAVHEWLGLALVVVLLWHAAYRGIHLTLAPLRNVERRFRVRRMVRLALDVALLAALAVCVVSGVMVSGAVLPAFGLYAEGYYFWNPLHAASAKVLTALLLVHVAVNASAVARRVRRLRRGSSEEKDA